MATVDRPRDRCPACGGSLTYERKKRLSNASHHIREYECGNCGRRVQR